MQKHKLNRLKCSANNVENYRKYIDIKMNNNKIQWKRSERSKTLKGFKLLLLIKRLFR